MKDLFDVQAIRLDGGGRPGLNAFTRFGSRQSIGVYFQGCEHRLENIVALADFRRSEDGLFMMAHINLLVTPWRRDVESFWNLGRQLWVNVHLQTTGGNEIQTVVDIKAVQLESIPAHSGGGSYMAPLFTWG